MVKKNNLCWIFIFLHVGINLAQEDSKEWIKQQLAVRAPAEHELLQVYSSLPEELHVDTKNGSIESRKSSDTYKYLESDKPENLLLEMAINVHEINHALTHAMPFVRYSESQQVLESSGINMYYYLLPDKKEFLINSAIHFFPAKELVQEIPDHLRTYRYQTYIGGTSSTQQDGVLALLDEFNSYLHTFSTLYLLKEAYLESRVDKVAAYVDWNASLNSYRSSFYEFNYFILEYMLLAREKFPEVYQAVRREKIMLIYEAIRNNFEMLILEQGKELKSGCKEFCKQAGTTSYIEGNTCYLNLKKGAMGFSLKDEAIDKLAPVLKSARYDLIRYELGINTGKK
jgi:hypothetical protein